MKPNEHANMSGECDMCRKKFKTDDVFIDGKTQGGPWADMCEDCFEQHGIGLGLGKGQKYQVSKSGNTFIKIGD